MDANSIKNLISENDLLFILTDLGAEPIKQGNAIVCRTVCHKGHKHKLYYYEESRMFKCFTDSCGSFDIFALIGKVNKMDFFSSFKFLCLKLGISYKYDAAENIERIDTSYFKKFNRENTGIEINPLDENILNVYDNLYHELWVKDGISVKTMKKFNIKFSIMDNQIIIPHYNNTGELVGVRARNLHEDLIEQGFKYIPVYYKGKFLKHPTGALLYGLDRNKNTIEKIKRVILFESEKSVLQLDSFLPEHSIGLCLSGSSLTPYQVDILKSLDIEEVVIGLDKEFDAVGSVEEKFYAQKIERVFADKLKPYFRVSVLWDLYGLLERQDSPTDRGRDVFNQLFKDRILL